MKKTISLIAIIFLISGCAKKEIEIETVNKEKNIIKDEINTYKDDNPVKIAFYENNKILNFI